MKDKLEIILIAAVSENNVIGYRGDIPWDIKEDRDRFTSLTVGHPIIMGRKTYESFRTRKEKDKNGEEISVKYLRNRTNIVLTASEEKLPQILRARHLYEAIELAQEHIPQLSKDKKIYIIGGQKVYEEAISEVANKLEITHVKGRHYKGDAYFPLIDVHQWKSVNREERDGYSFETYVRR